ncbi:FAD:protein FMN transferase [Desulfohalovibrio reitneri]|uniref:FAD:protein FMN transferase n=1 Tax=Desulfohalovibrio reitneri TaxID=1307759 RepID=UPI00069027FA|nr:FAD:protein FMN transferase [Desulfohalovibrio reitneri]
MISRRRFLGLAATAAAGCLVPAFAGAERLDGRVVAQQLRTGMGTFVAVVAADASRDRAEEAVGLAFRAMESLEPIFSRFNPASPVSVLNERSRVDAPPELADLAGRCHDLHARTAGAFNPLVLPAQRVLESGSDDPGAVREALALADMNGFSVRGRELRFEKSGMGLTLDGAAKGVIVDRMAEALERAGVSNYCVNAGGDVRVSGRTERGEPWLVAVENPLGGRREILALTSGGLATSGGYEVSYGPEELFHHILDPARGGSPRGQAQATAHAPTCGEADALATALLVGGPRRGLEWLGPGRHARLVSRDGGAIASPGWNTLRG